jgi:L-lactate dehydrogenase complex protein LldG
MEIAHNGREEILAKLRKGRAQRNENEFPDPEWNSSVFPIPADLLETFKTELETIFGKVVIENSDAALIQRLKEILAERNVSTVYCLDEDLRTILGSDINIDFSDEGFKGMQAGITRCEQLIARTGSLVVSSAHESGRRMNVFPPLHLVWAKASQLVPFVEDAIEQVKNRYYGNLPSQISVITGPSRTADIEKTLVLGAHGPRELIVLINKEA